MPALEDLEKDIALIKKRNLSVETDKAWETSRTRRLIIMTFTYILIGTFFVLVGVSDPWINALVPTFGFFLSTLALPFCKSLWKKYLFKD